MSSVDPIFAKRMADLQDAMKLDGTLLQTGGTTTWAKLYDGAVLNGFSHTEFVTAFNRDATNTAYLKLVQPKDGESPSYRDAQAAKVQIDLVAGMERDLRMRYRSRVRMLAHGVARLQSHGSSIGPINKGIVNFVKLLLDRQT